MKVERVRQVFYNFESILIDIFLIFIEFLHQKPAIYSPEIKEPTPRASKKPPKTQQSLRMENCDDKDNIWDKYRKKVKHLVRIITRETFYFDTLTQETRKKSFVIDLSIEGAEAIASLDRLKAAKVQLKDVLQEITTHNKDHKVRYDTLYTYTHVYTCHIEVIAYFLHLTSNYLFYL